MQGLRKIGLAHMLSLRALEEVRWPNQKLHRKRKAWISSFVAEGSNKEMRVTAHRDLLFVRGTDREAGETSPFSSHRKLFAPGGLRDQQMKPCPWVQRKGHQAEAIGWEETVSRVFSLGLR